MIQRLAERRADTAGRRADTGHITVAGAPWNPQIPLYHATVALGAIRAGGLKTRRELEETRHGGVLHATGGGTDRAISFTLDHRVALAIVVGLETFRKLAQVEIGPREFLARLEHEIGAEHLQHAIASVYGCGLDSTDCIRKMRADLERGMEEKSARWGVALLEEQQLPAGGEVVHYWHDVLGTSREDWLASTYIDRETGETRHRTVQIHAWRVPMSRLDLARKLAEVYKAGIAYASEDRVYNPLFMLGSLRAFQHVRKRDIGLFEATVSGLRLCPDGPNSWLDLGASRAEVVGPQDFLFSWGSDCLQRAVPDLRGRVDPSDYKTRSSWLPQTLLGLPFDPTPRPITPQTTMPYLGAMREVRVADLRKVVIRRFLPYSTLVRAGLLDPNRLTFPAFPAATGHVSVPLPTGG